LPTRRRCATSRSATGNRDRRGTRGGEAYRERGWGAAAGIEPERVGFKTLSCGQISRFAAGSRLRTICASRGAFRCRAPPPFRTWDPVWVRKLGHPCRGDAELAAGSVGDSRPLEVACAVVACVRCRSPSVRAGAAPLSVDGVERVGDPGAAARALDSAPPDATTADARPGPAVAGGAESRSPSTRVDGLLGQSAHAAALAGTSGSWHVAGRTRIGGLGRPRIDDDVQTNDPPVTPGWVLARKPKYQSLSPRSSGVTLSASSVRSILIRRGLPPAPERGSAGWRRFLRQQAATMLACDFLTSRPSG
jgi:hypothetical protein